MREIPRYCGIPSAVRFSIALETDWLSAQDPVRCGGLSEPEACFFGCDDFPGGPWVMRIAR
jgi:hypothetical protein